MTISIDKIARLIRANVPVGNMALITGTDAETLTTELIPAACDEFGLVFTPTPKIAA